MAHSGADGVLTQAEFEQVVRSATMVVAASDASAASRALADYFCDGVADDVQIQAAIDALPAVGGKVKLTEGNFSSGSLSLVNCLLEGQGEGLSIGTIITLTSPGSTITVDGKSKLRNLQVLVASDYTGTAVLVESTVGGTRHGTDVLDKVRIWHAGSGADLIKGTGLLIRALSTSGNLNVSLSSFGSIYVYGFEYGVKLYATETSNLGYVNGNIFGSLVFERNKHPLHLEGVGTAYVAGNIFQSIEIQPSSDTVDGIHIVGNSDYNIFLAVFAWDWATASGSSILIDSGVVYTYAKGWLPSYTDNGTNSTIIDIGRVIENAGTSNIASGQTTKVVAHGLVTTPSR